MKFSSNISLLFLILGALVLVCVSANPVERVKRAYDYTPPEGGAGDLFGDNEIPDGGDDDGFSASVSSDDGNNYASASISSGPGQASASSLSANTFEFEKPEYTPKCCAHCTCT
ncbi:uncharacterized protein LOC134837747 [Culicoides brevitarsis]|uniref:uncharacterized protein LOC134837747 n=1 Tax=Culicoides brevitarsis TaxID=469753 RepID=UPI00307C3C89